MEYYDTEWGVPVRNEHGLFERICLEAFQCGLSWLTVLRRREQLRDAFADFVPDVVATFTNEDIERLTADSRVIRNRAKISAVVSNARATVALRERGGLSQLVWSFQPEVTPEPRTMAEIPPSTAESEALSRALKKAGFRFVGPTTAFALMEAVGVVDTHLMGSHRRGVSGLWPR